MISSLRFFNDVARFASASSKKIKNKELAFLSIVFSLILLLSLSSPVYAQKRQRSKSKAKTIVVSDQKKPQTSAEAKKQQVEAQKEIQLTEQQIRQNEANVKKGLDALGKLDQSIAASNKKIRELNTKISNLKGEISGLESGIEKNEKDLETLRSEYLKAVKKMRVTKKNKSTLAFLFSSKSLNQAMRRMRYLREFSDWRSRQTNEINAKTADLKNQKDALTKAQNEEANALSLQKREMAKLASEHTQQELIVNDLKKNGAALKSHLKKKQTEALELGKMVSLLIADEQRKAAEEEAKRKAEEEARRKAEEEERQRLLAQEELLKSQDSEPVPSVKEPKKSKSDKKSKESKTNQQPKNTVNTQYADARKRKPRKNSSDIPSASPQATAASSFADMRGSLPSPSSGSFTITSPFGRQAMADLPDVEYDNPGIDAESEAGATARAVFNGKVSGVYLLPGYNTVVILNHGSYYTVYGNISSPAVKIGDQVETGSNLGKLALKDEDTAHSSIHFEVWKNREKLNPQDWLR